MSKEEHYEERKRLYNQFKTDCPQTIGETDKAFDNDNFIDWLVDNQNTNPLIEKISSLEASLLDVTRKSCARVDELKDEIADLKSQLLISEQKVKLNYNCAIESSKSEATTNELELSVRIRQYIEKTHESDITPESLTKVFLDNYKPKSEANEAAYGYIAIHNDKIISGIYTHYHRIDEDYPNSNIYEIFKTRNNK